MIPKIIAQPKNDDEELLKMRLPNEELFEINGFKNKGIPLEEILDKQKYKDFFFKNNYFSNCIEKENELNNLLLNPPSLTEGELECPFCKSKNTFIEEKQTRSADEGFTYFMHCLNEKCKKISKM